MERDYAKEREAHEHYRKNTTRIWLILEDVVTGKETPSAVGHALFKWQDDMINERCPPFSIHDCEVYTGDTLVTASDYSLTVYMEIISLSNQKELLSKTYDINVLHESLAELARVFRGLVLTRKWIAYGDTMDCDDNLILSNLCNVCPDRELYKVKFPAEEAKIKLEKDMVAHARFLALLGEQPGFLCLRGFSFRSLYWKFMKTLDSDLYILQIAAIMEVSAKSLYNYKSAHPSHPTQKMDNERWTKWIKGGCGELYWPEWLETMTKVAEDRNRTEEVLEAARKTVEVMVRVEEEAKQEREAKVLEAEEAKNGDKGLGESEDEEVWWMKRRYIKNWGANAPPGPPAP